MAGLPIRAKYKRISEQFVSILVTLLQQMLFLLLEVMVVKTWISDFVELLNRFVCMFAISFHSFSLHDLPCHRTMRKCLLQILLNKVILQDRQLIHIIRPRCNLCFRFHKTIFYASSWHPGFKQISAIVHNIFPYYAFALSATQKKHGQGKMLVLPYRLLYWVLSTSVQDFVSFQTILCHPHTQTRIILFHDVQRDIPNLEFAPIHVLIGLSRIAFPTIVLPKDDRTDFVQEERLDLPHWTMI